MKKSVGFLTVLMMAGLIGCSDGAQFMPEQVINNAINQSQPSSYYAEANMKTTGLDGEIEHIELKEWTSKEGHRRTETKLKDGKEQSISVYTDSHFVSYFPEVNQVLILDDNAALAELNQISPKDQFMHLLRTVQDSHEITAKGEETIAGRKAYHITAKAKDDNSLLGDQDIWIDKEQWIILKFITTSGDLTNELEYTTFEMNPDLPANLFTLEYPDDAKLLHFDDIVDEPEAATLEEAVKALGRSFLYFPETDSLQLTRIEMMETSGEWARTEINLDYEKEGTAYFMMSVFPTPQDEDDFGKLPGEQDVVVRNQAGTYMEMNEFRSLVWTEDGLSYSVMLIDPNLTLEAFIERTNEMVMIE